MNMQPTEPAQGSGEDNEYRDLIADLTPAQKEYLILRLEGRIKGAASTNGSHPNASNGGAPATSVSSDRAYSGNGNGNGHTGAEVASAAASNGHHGSNGSNPSNGNGHHPPATIEIEPTHETQVVIPRVRRDRPLPLSPSQRGMWAVERYFQGSAAGNLPISLEIRGPLDLRLLNESINRVIQRHEILRARFVFEGDDPRQSVRPASEATFSIGFADISNYPPVDRELTAFRLFHEEILRPFHLEDDLLIRANVVLLEPERFFFFLNVQHIVFDAFSAGLLLKDIQDHYLALRAGKAEDLPGELPLQYLDYAVWRRFADETGDRDRALEYWKRQLQGLRPPSIPFDHPRPTIAPMQNEGLHLFLAADLVERLRVVSRDAGCTLFTTMLAAFYVLLYRYSGSSDLSVLSVLNQRDNAAVSEMLGVFINIVVLRLRLEGNPTFQEIVAGTHQLMLDAEKNSEPVIGEVLNVSEAPLPSLIFQMLAPAPDHVQWHDLRVTPVLYSEGMSRFNAEFHFVPQQNGAMRGLALYNRDLYDKTTFVRLIEHYRFVLETIAGDPARRLADIPLENEAARKQLVERLVGKRSRYPREKLIHELFSEQAARTPDGIALSFGGERWTYAELDRRTDELAVFLRLHSGLRPETPIGIYMERSANFIIAVLTILKAGGAYVPLDPSYPDERLAFMLTDSGAPLILTIEKLERDAGRFGTRTLALDGRLPNTSYSPLNGSPPPTLTAHNLAYIMYTSGSTGKPRPVGVTHQNVIRLVRGQEFVQIEPGDASLLLAPLSFDASTFELWAPLLSGGEVVIFPPGLPSFKEIGGLIERRNVKTLWLTASLFHRMVESDSESLKHVPQLLTGGDVVSVWHARRYLENGGGRLINGYGPTENTTFTSTHTMTHVHQLGEFVSIGRPLSNTDIYILDESLRPCPVGIPGELYTSGDGLSRGYIGRPALTAERFLPNPFSGEPGSRMYRTGDLARWLPDGNLQFLGRMDEQFKFNGHRIEPGEIEGHLNGSMHVEESAVLLQYRPEKRATGEFNTALEPELMAFVRPRKDRASAPALSEQDLSRELSTYLKSRLPAHMVPSRFEFIEEMPLSPNGKIDRAALLAREVNRYIPESKFVAPDNTTERKLLGIWESLLDKDEIGVTDNFFELGGTSMMAVRMQNEITKTLDTDIPLAIFLTNPTVRGLARSIRRGTASVNQGPVAVIRPVGSRPPLFCVHPLGGNSFCYMNLARELGDEQPFYAFQCPGLEGGPLFWSVEDTARHYVQYLREMQPRGPYYLGGWSFGGYVAMEMTRLIEAAGESVSLLALFDPPPPPTGGIARGLNPISVAFSIAELVRLLFLANFKSYDDIHAMALSAGLRLPPASDAMHLEVEEISEYVREFVTDVPRIVSTIASNFIATMRYAPRPIDFYKTVLFRVTENLSPITDNEVDAWSPLLPAMEIQPVPGNHMTMFDRSNAGVLAERLRMWLSRARYTDQP